MWRNMMLDGRGEATCQQANEEGTPLSLSHAPSTEAPETLGGDVRRTLEDFPGRIRRPLRRTVDIATRIADCTEIRLFGKYVDGIPRSADLLDVVAVADAWRPPVTEVRRAKIAMLMALKKEDLLWSAWLSAEDARDVAAKGYVLTHDGRMAIDEGLLLYRRTPPYDVRTVADPKEDPPWAPRGDLERFRADGRRRTLDELPEDVRTIALRAAAVCAAEPGCLKVWLYGSWAWGEPTSKSDVDVLALVDDALKDKGRKTQQEMLKRYMDSPGIRDHFMNRGRALHLRVFTESWFLDWMDGERNVQGKLRTQGVLLYAR